MHIEFQSQERAPWKRPGRPPRRASERALNALRQTARTGKVAVISLDTDVTGAELAELRRDLKAAQRELGGRVHTQLAEGKFMFYWQPANE